ncbi:DUF3934 domain-containing protein, partial [Clostridium perfringens]
SKPKPYTSKGAKQADGTSEAENHKGTP